MRLRSDRTERLKQSVEYHYRRLKTLRQSREELLRAAAGALSPHAGIQEGLDDILNLMRQAAEAQTLALAANRPRVLAVSQTIQRANFARHYTNAVNAYLKHMHAEEAFQECARNSFYSLGIMKIYLAESVAVELEVDEWMDPGKVFMASVSPHHFNYDTDATDFRHCSFLADRYRVRILDAVKDTRFPAKTRKWLESRGVQSRSMSTEAEWGEELGGGYDASEFDDYLYFCDIFLPKDGTIETYVCDDQFRIEGDRLTEPIEWTGSEMGPYRFLNLGPVPDKTTPSSPAQNLLLQHNLVNSLYRKLEAQALRQKLLNVGSNADADDMIKLRDAPDGDFVPVQNPEAIKPIRLDGPDQPVFSFTLNALDQFSKQAGNLEHKLGLSASADTAKQQGMIGESVSRMEAFYQGRFVSFAREVVTEVARLLFAHPTAQIPMTRKIPGTSFEVDSPWKGSVEEGSREGEFSDYDLDVEPHSAKYRSPEDRIREIDAQVQMLIPIVPMLVEQGQMLDLKYWLQTRGEYADMPELDRLLKDIPPPEPPNKGSGPSHERTLSGPGGGEYIHRTESGGGGGEPQLPTEPQPSQLAGAGADG